MDQLYLLLALVACMLVLIVHLRRPRKEFHVDIDEFDAYCSTNLEKCATNCRALR